MKIWAVVMGSFALAANVLVGWIRTYISESNTMQFAIS